MVVVRKCLFLCLCFMPAFASAGAFQNLPSHVSSQVQSAGEWQINLLSYPTIQQAESFLDRLKNKGFLAEIATVHLAGNIRYQVRISGLHSLGEAKAYRASLKEKTNIHDDHIRILASRHTAIQAGWAIHLITFAASDKATSFIQRLKDKGFDADIVPLFITDTPMYLTRIPALASLDDAHAYQQRLKQHTNISLSHLKIVGPARQMQVPNKAAYLLPQPRSPPEPVQHVVAGVGNSSDGDSPKTGNGRLKTSQHNPPTASIQQPTGKTALNSFSSKLLPDWHIYGSNTWRSDVYHSKGNLAASPYRFSNTHTYDELNLNADRIFSPFHRITGQISGLLYNDSKYRSQFPGFVLERVNLRQENGAFFIPYRAEAGDFFAFQSFRTIQRSLKGGRIEFQPQWGGANFRHSIELFSGAASPAWDVFQYKDDFSSGGSWLLQHPLVGTLSGNLVFNNKQANGLAQPGLRQRVGSLAWEKRAALLGQKLVIEAEAGRFIGDHPVVVVGRPNTHRQGNGYFGQISGSFDALPQLSYRIRGEGYEQDYFPNGASIQSDRNSQEAYLTWRTASGLAFSPRFQHYHTGWQTNNPTDTITYGGNISGMIPVFGGISGSIDGFGSDVESRDLTTNTMAKVVNANISMPLSENLSARGGFYYANNNNKNSALGLNITRQYSGGLDYRLQWQGISGSISIGALARRMDQQGVRWWEGNPTFNANLIYGDHSLSLALSKLDQVSQIANNGVDTMTAGLNYRYTQPKYTVGLDANWYDRQPDNAGAVWTNAWRVGAYITYNFDKPVMKLAMAEPQTATDASPSTPSIERMLMDIARFTPGMPVNDAKAMVSAAGLGEPSNQAGLLIWYAQIFRDMSENQRLALDVQQGRVLRSAVIIDFFDPGNNAGIRTAFERMRRQLLAVYGQPDDFFDQGDFGPNIVTELAAGRFIQVMQWNRDGGIVRFGIPRRLDGKVRMELQFGRNFPSLKDTLWSMEQVQ